MGLGNERQRTRFGIFEALRLRDCAERSHPSSAPESRRQCDFPHCDVYCFPATRARNGILSRANESAGGKATQHAWPNERSISTRQILSCRRRFKPQLILKYPCINSLPKTRRYEFCLLS